MSFGRPVAWVRGDLAGVSAYGTDAGGVLPPTTQLVDPAAPAVGAGWYYLVRPDCAVGSWQTTEDAEPGRDAALP